MTGISREKAVEWMRRAGLRQPMADVVFSLEKDTEEGSSRPFPFILVSAIAPSN